MIMQILGKEHCDSKKKCYIDENTLDGRDRFPGVFEIIPGLIQDLKFAENPKPTPGNCSSDNRNQKIIHQEKK